MFNLCLNNSINISVKPIATAKAVAALKCKKLKRKELCFNIVSFADLEK
jgi:hypothetical protein